MEQYHMVSLLFHFHQNNLGIQIKKRAKINFCTKWVTTAPCDVFKSFIDLLFGRAQSNSVPT